MRRDGEEPSNPGGDETHRLAAATDADASHLCLLVFGESSRSSYPLPATPLFTLGRSTESQISIADASISRNHAVLEQGPPLRIRDAGSANGVVVHGRRLAPGEAEPIALGDAIEIGTVLVVVTRGSAHVAQSAAREPHADALTVRPGPPDAAGPIEDAAGEVVVVDPAMSRVYHTVRRIAPSDLSVLVLGETGVGKELIAETIHRLSPRAHGPFLRLNCAALSAPLLESELFGYERGAFTGAQQPKPGLLEAAGGGTVFLDEIGELPMTLQVKLLRVLEERRVLRVGALKPRDLDVRFVAATNRDLRAEVDSGSFRRDLYFRLDGISIVVPPLRERAHAEIERLAHLFLERACVQRGRADPPALSEAALTMLLSDPWTGNVRELRNAIERAAWLCDSDELLPEHLAPSMSRPALGDFSRDRADGRATPEPASTRPRENLRTEVKALERARIEEALEQCAGNQTRAAKLLGVSRRTLVKWIRAHDLPRPRKPRAT